jgi:hypothetical protein
MLSARRPLFEVVTSANANARALTTADNVRALIGSPTADDALITTLIDRASANMARYCRLASDTTGAMPTFALEACKATWAPTGFSSIYPYPRRDEPDRLILPWRKPIAMTALTEDGTTLVASADYRLMPGGILERLDASSGAPKLWSQGVIVATFNSGFSLPSDAPPDLEQACIDQVKFWYLTRKRDPSLRSEQVPDIYQAAYSVAGGDSIGESGLLVSVEGALAPYKDWSQG